MDSVPMMVKQDLNFDMTCSFQIAFEIDAIVAESFTSLILCEQKRMFKLFWPFDQSYTAPTAPGHRLEHQRKAHLSDCLQSFGKRVEHRSSWQERETGLRHS